MARYNTVSSTSSVTGGSTITTPSSGLLTTLTGSGTVTVPNPVLYTGQTQTFYNSTASTIPLTTPSGNFIAPGFTSSGTINLPAGSILTIVSDGTNYEATSWLGGTISTSNLVGYGVFERTGLVANATKQVMVQASNTGVNVNVYGIETSTS